MVICRGMSPLGAANWAITNEIVESYRARIVRIPANVEWRIDPKDTNRLLSEAECNKLGKSLGFHLITTNKA